MKFQRSNNDITFNIEFPVSAKDNLASIRQKICDNLWKPSEINQKHVKFIHNANVLDVNKKLMTLVPEQDSIINCELHPNGEILILNVEIDGKSRDQIKIEIKKEYTVSDLKTILFDIIKTEVLAIFKDNQELFDEEIGSSVNDNDNIRVVLKTLKHFAIQHVLEQSKPIEIEISNSEKVLKLKEQIEKKIACKMDEFALFHRYKFLEENAYIYDYNFDEHDQIYYCTFKKFTEIDNYTKEKNKAAYSDIYKSKGKLIKLYNYAQTTEDLKPLIRELISFTKIQIHPRIVQFLGFYRDGENFLIEMENVAKGSVELYVKNVYQQYKTGLNESLIKKWVKQILEGLQYLHKNRIIFRDLKTSNILIDVKDDIKLSGLSLSRYFIGCTTDELRQGIPQTKTGTFRYMAPEVYNNQPYGTKADVWSLGATLVEMASGQPPCPNLNSVRAGYRIARDKQISYPAELSPKMKRFIDRCLKPVPDDRATVDELLEDEFVKIM